MSLSYVVMLIAFYVDNGKQLPVWKDLPHFTITSSGRSATDHLSGLLWHPLVVRMKRAAHP
jgi:hypothetical protein